MSMRPTEALQRNWKSMASRAIPTSATLRRPESVLRITYIEASASSPHATEYRRTVNRLNPSNLSHKACVTGYRGTIQYVYRLMPWMWLVRKSAVGSSTEVPIYPELIRFSAGLENHASSHHG